MIEPDDALEAELSRLRPRQVSPVLRRRVSERLAAARGTWLGRPVHSWRIAAVSGMAAAVVALLLIVLADRSDDRQPADPEVPSPSGGVASAPTIAPEVEATLPTYLVYSRAIAQSPDELDALFDEHARLGSQPGPDQPRAFARMRLDDGLSPFSGAL